MVAADSSSIIAFLQGQSGPDVSALESALSHHLVVLPPVVLSELLSEPTLDEELGALFKSLPLLEIVAGYWERTGRLRAQVLAQGRRAPLADSLIAQSCIDHQVPLVSRDADFQHFSRASSLEVIQ